MYIIIPGMVRTNQNTVF